MKMSEKTTKVMVIVIVVLICERIIVPVFNFLIFPIPYYLSIPSGSISLLLIAGSIFLLSRRPTGSPRNSAIFGLVIAIISILLWGLSYFSAFSGKACSEIAPDADLRRCNLRNLNLDGVDLNGADLSDANLSDSSFVGSNLSGVNLQGAHIFHSDLTRADLSGADLSGASISGTSFVDSQLDKADLSESDIGFCDFTRANLDHAVLRDAELSSIIISETSANGAIFDGAVLSSESELDEGFISGIASWTTPDSQSLGIACHGNLGMVSPYQEDSDFHPTLIVDLPGDPEGKIAQSNQDWGPADLRDLELVVCSAEEYIQIRTCEYFPAPGINVSPSKIVERYQHQLTITIRSAYTGEILSEVTFQGPEPNCPMRNALDEKYAEVKGDPVELPDTVFTWIAGYVHP